MSRKEFNFFSNLVQEMAGIKMPETKQVMLQSRLQKRLRALQLDSFQKYIDYIKADSDQRELVNLLDVVSTNKTDFFREPAHFHYMAEELLPQYQDKKHINILSAGCSSGEEPYTIAMVIEEFSRLNQPIDYHILGTDISTVVLQKGINAIYDEAKVNVISRPVKERYLLRSKNPVDKKVKIVASIRKKVSFKRMNFMEANFHFDAMYDIIFCRNMLIYFDKPNQEYIVNRLCKYLKKDGTLFLGHSETITNMKAPLKQLRPTVYKRL